MASLQLKRVVRSYAATTVIHGVDLDVRDGEFVVFVGPSGCGKSTLLRMISGLESVSDGEIRIDDKRVNDVSAAQRGLAMVFQSYALYPHMTVKDNMAFGLKMRGMPRDDIERRVSQAANLLELGPLLNGLVNYEYWLPVPKMMYPGIGEMIAEYQSRAAAEGADPLGYYVAPQAYAQMQIVGQAVTATGSLDDATLARFTRDHLLKTILGDVKFGAGGSWSEARVLQVQYRNINSNDISNFRRADTQAVVWPRALASAEM